MSIHSLPNRQPDASLHDPRPEYLRALVEQSGLSQVECARRIGVDASTFRRYLGNGKSALRADYRTQFALEALASAPDRNERGYSN
jgi:transcriptional regulator with XRE-family HTH domain